MELRGEVLLRRLAHMLEGPIVAEGQRLLRRRHAHLLRGQALARGLVCEAVNHVPLRGLGVVALVVLRVRPLVDIALVAVGAAVAVEVPLQEGHGLRVHELVLQGGAHDVGVAHADGAHVGGHLHGAAGLHEGAQGTEEEAHEVLVAPVHQGVAVEEALDGAGVGEVVVDGAEGVLHALKARVDGDARAVHAVVDLGEVLLERLDALVDLLVALPQRLHLFEGGRNDPAHVAERLAMLCELQ
mmetsp:Transcript_6533/g.21026  ORF Transcript_6533/g.21026 Transcript_6533/m.21026 type:complete len:242 (+) Transcript_6533:124-849(+)